MDSKNKIKQINVYIKRNRLTDIENKLMVTKGEREGLIRNMKFTDTNYYT